MESTYGSFSQYFFDIFLMFIGLGWTISILLAYSSIDLNTAPDVVKYCWSILLNLGASFTTLCFTISLCRYYSPSDCTLFDRGSYLILIFMLMSLVVIITSSILLIKYNEGDITYDSESSSNKKLVEIFLGLGVAILVISLVTNYIGKLKKNVRKLVEYINKQSSDTDITLLTPRNRIRRNAISRSTPRNRIRKNSISPSRLRNRRGGVTADTMYKDTLDDWNTSS